MKNNKVEYHLLDKKTKQSICNIVERTRDKEYLKYIKDNQIRNTVRSKLSDVNLYDNKLFTECLSRNNVLDEKYHQGEHFQKMRNVICKVRKTIAQFVGEKAGYVYFFSKNIVKSIGVEDLRNVQKILIPCASNNHAHLEVKDERMVTDFFVKSYGSELHKSDTDTTLKTADEPNIKNIITVYTSCHK